MLIEALGLSPAILVGHGLGAHLALLAAEARPQSVRGLFLTAAAPWVLGERDGQVGGLPEDFVRFVTAQKDRASVPYAQTCFELGDKWMFHKPPGPGVGQWILEQALTWPQIVLERYAASMRQIDHRERLARIACPTLIAQGRHDRKQRYEGAIYLANAMPNARLEDLREQRAYAGDRGDRRIQSHAAGIRTRGDAEQEGGLRCEKRSTTFFQGR